MPTLVVEVEVAASPLQVFDVFATGDGLARWLPVRAPAGAVAGACVEVTVAPGAPPLRLRIDRLEPPELIVWTCIDGIPEWRGTTLRVEISRGAHQTVVRLTHNGWRWREPGGLLASSGFSWPRQVLRLAEVVRTASRTAG